MPEPGGKQPRLSWRYVVYALLAVVLLVNAFLYVGNPSDLDRFLIDAMLGLSVFVTLDAGLLSLANAGFMAIGAYSSAILVVRAGFPLLPAVLGAMVICGIIGVAIGLPVLRLRDVYLAIATIGFGEIVRILIVTNPGLTGGATGANLSTGFQYDKMKQTQTWMLVLALAVLIYAFYWLAHSRTGRAFRAMRANPQAAETMGINVVSYRVLAFVLSAMIAGAAGSLYAHDIGSLDNNDFSFNRAVQILSYAVLGGSTHWFGSILGAGLLSGLPVFLREFVGGSIPLVANFAQLPNIISGLALMLVIIFLPAGLYAPGRRQTAAPVKTGEVEEGTVPEAPALELSAERRNGEAGQPHGPLLEMKDVRCVFGGVTALDGVDLAVKEGEIHGLIGPNGAGKTTLINLISGFCRPASGRIIFREADITHMPAYRIAQLGVARTYQNIRLFGEMTVLENVVVGRHAHIRTNLLTTWLRLPRERREERDAAESAMALLERLGLEGLAGVPARELSYGDQRRVEIARALASQPHLLLLDEPAAGLTNAEAAALAEFLLELKRRRYTILAIEHHMDLIMRVSDEIMVLNFGRAIAEGALSRVRQDPEVIEAYLGQE